MLVYNAAIWFHLCLIQPYKRVCPWLSMLMWWNLSEWGCAVWGVYAAAGIEWVNEPVRVIMFACLWFSLQIWSHICVRAHGLMCFVDSTAQKHVREEDPSSHLSLSPSFILLTHKLTNLQQICMMRSCQHAPRRFPGSC